jgi:hypothetical protein
MGFAAKHRPGVISPITSRRTAGVGPSRAAALVRVEKSDSASEIEATVWIRREVEVPRGAARMDDAGARRSFEVPARRSPARAARGRHTAARAEITCGHPRFARDDHRRGDPRRRIAAAARIALACALLT